MSATLGIDSESKGCSCKIAIGNPKTFPEQPLTFTS
jgi:hypothetical protein